ncbi:malto-oligosyltrehalose synthase [Lichenicola cladoniae]|uniref:Malto-oligosyltrehalose synthase n=1 Tax=Lichenicola cladoniae TaxID=1484109 RepID=A0A6M8HTK3_9PROT|nr:malto-oligosyltrehalose synthase [Lichenicola cladoniae]NPD68241.1 malto-oligosyltrehalose synthase [Acetobacteraceae bacterium]QKE91843.1 malto-oligosyltrehalose synthase [Lichenicola cladoniae]
MTTPASVMPRATYRLQFHAGFGFKDATAIAPYLGRLGVSHVYASPYLKARPGSTHGYDITDHQALNPELGTEEDFSAMVAALRQAGLGQILDFVPNHMGVGGSDNPLWLDVLEWGPESEHAGWFDIDWDPDRRYLLNKLLVPFLGDQYGVELKAGNLALKYDEDEGTLAVWAYDTHKLPICPLFYDRILAHENAGLDRLSDLFSDLPMWRPQVAERARALKAELAALLNDDAEARAALDAQIASFNGDWKALDALIQEQFWRVAYYGVAGDDINYRRFFNINDLAGLRMELPAVFRHAHARIIPWVEDGTLDGIRLDHVDGLLDPKRYFDDLRAASTRPFYLVIEKILAAHEQLREDWPVEGTTGYDFTNLVLGAMINPAAEESFTETYKSFTGLVTPFAEIVRECKIRIMENEMASELNVLGRDAGRVARQNPMTADFTRNILQRAIKQIVASFPVYRTYIDMDGAQEDADRRDLDWAMAQARRGDSNIDPSVFDFLHGALSGQVVAAPKSGFSRTAVLRFAMKLQQYSGPVMAKGLEDTTFYRYNRHVALNEVGGEPERFGISANAFHKANAQRAKNWPHAMLGTSTHDTKRGEDTRARLAVLSDLPEEWSRQVTIWSRLLRARRGDIGGNAPPDRNDEYLLYQLLVGSWPVELLEQTDEAALQVYAERLKGALEKSMREAKLHSTWTAPDTAYEDAMQAFARDALDTNRGGFLASFLPFAQRVARLGVQNSLIQTVMKLTLPGMPDIYQGCEMWDLSLVDPDNRRPVDYTVRQVALADLEPRLEHVEGRGSLLGELLQDWHDGRIKLAVTALLLDLRREQTSLFATGSYEPVSIEGGKSDQALGYMRGADDQRLVVLVARYPGLRETDPDWGDTVAMLPDGRWTDWLSGRVVEGGQAVKLGELFDVLPAVVLRSS